MKKAVLLTLIFLTTLLIGNVIKKNENKVVNEHYAKNCDSLSYVQNLLNIKENATAWKELLITYSAESIRDKNIFGPSK